MYKYNKELYLLNTVALYLPLFRLTPEEKRTQRRGLCIVVHLYIYICDTLPLDNPKIHLHTALPYITLCYRSTFASCTVRGNWKDLPCAAGRAKLKKRGSIVHQNENTLAICWHDKREIYILITIHDATLVKYEVDHEVMKFTSLGLSKIILDICKMLIWVNMMEENVHSLDKQCNYECIYSAKKV